MVHLLIKNIDFFFAEKVGTENVETGTLFGELHATLGAEVLQRDILKNWRVYRENTGVCRENTSSILKEYKSVQRGILREYSERILEIRTFLMARVRFQTKSYHISVLPSGSSITQVTR